MSKSFFWILVFIGWQLLGQLVNADSLDSLKLTQQGCSAFKNKLSADERFISGTVEVPADWSNPQHGETLPVFWWKRAGKDPSFPPIAFIHGGPAGNSWALVTRWKEVLDNYPGDVVAFDHRGEGCSKTLRSNLPLAAYSAYGVRSIVNDMEFLRQNVYHYSKWRIVGHSRGAAIVHYYLEMAPGGLESAHAMGFSIMPGVLEASYPYLRAFGFARTATAYLTKYPGDAELVENIKKIVTSENLCWQGMDNRKLCGPGVVDMLGAVSLKYVSSWSNLHALIVSMTDKASIQTAIGSQLANDVYGHFNYIIATNGQEFGGPDSVATFLLKSSHSSLYESPFLSEIRYLGDAIAPTVDIDWRGNFNVLDYGKVLRFLSQAPGFKYYLYPGAVDPIAPPEMYSAEISLLGSRVNVLRLPQSAHDGWFDPILIENIMRKNFFGEHN